MQPGPKETNQGPKKSTLNRELKKQVGRAGLNNKKKEVGFPYISQIK